MSNIRKVNKNLIGMEDLASGVGKTTQKRGGKWYDITKVDTPFAVTSEEEIKYIDTSKFTRASLGDMEWRYNPHLKDGDIPVAVGSWTRSNVSMRYVESFAEAAKFELTHFDEVKIGNNRYRKSDTDISFRDRTEQGWSAIRDGSTKSYDTIADAQAAGNDHTGISRIRINVERSGAEFEKLSSGEAVLLPVEAKFQDTQGQNWGLIINKSTIPEHFGAIGDGVANDADIFTAMQQMTLDINPKQGSVYGVDSTIKAIEGVTFNKVQFKRLSTAHSIFISISVPDVSVKFCEFDNNNIRSSVNSTTVNILVNGDPSGLYIHKNKFINPAGARNNIRGDDAILFDYYRDLTSEAVATENTIIGFHRNGIAVTSGNTFRISKNYIRSCGNAGIDIEPYQNSHNTKDGYVEENILIDNGNGFGGDIPYKAFNLAVINAHVSGGSLFDNLNVTGNIIINNGSEIRADIGVYPVNCKGVSNITFENNKVFVRGYAGTNTLCEFEALTSTESGKNNSIRGNTFQVYAWNAFNSNNGSIQDNYFLESKIQLGTLNDISFNRNKIVNQVSEMTVSSFNGTIKGNKYITDTPVANPALLVNKSDGSKTNITVDGNFFIGGFTRPVTFESPKYGLDTLNILRNEFTGCQDYAIYCKNSFYTKVAWNKILDCPSGVYVKAAKECSIKSNILDGVTANPITIDGSSHVYTTENEIRATAVTQKNVIRMINAGSGAFKPYALIKDNMTNLSSAVTPIVGDDGSGSVAGVIIKGNEQPQPQPSQKSIKPPIKPPIK